MTDVTNKNEYSGSWLASASAAELARLINH
jgi:hypothetical protein